MENANETKKQVSILNKTTIIAIYCFLSVFTVDAQQQVQKLEKSWQQLHEKHNFQRDKKYSGPKTEGYLSPTEITKNQPLDEGSTNSGDEPYQGIPYDSKNLKRGKNRSQDGQYGENSGGGSIGDGGSGTIQYDPNISPPEPIDFPDVNEPDVEFLNFSSPVWKYIGILILLILLVFIIFQIIRNQSPKSKSIPFEPLEEDFNPASISKTELELRLEEAKAREDYRECVRIYFLFAMKDLIERRWIVWKKEKTNAHYVIEMSGKSTFQAFENVVSIYDLVWYGDYSLTKNSYHNLEPQLQQAYSTIESTKA